MSEFTHLISILILAFFAFLFAGKLWGDLIEEFHKIYDILQDFLSAMRGQREALRLIAELLSADRLK